MNTPVPTLNEVRAFVASPISNSTFRRAEILRIYSYNFLTHTFLKVFQIGITNLLDEQLLVYRL